MKKKILFLTPQLPYPPQQGTSIRNFHILKGLAERYELSLLSFLEEGQIVSEAAPLLALCDDVWGVPVPPHGKGKRIRHLLFSRIPDMGQRLNSGAYRKKLTAVLAETNYEIVQVEGLELARYIPDLRRLAPDSLIVFDNHNAETELQKSALQTDWKQPKRWLAALYSWLQIPRLGRFERDMGQLADRVTVVSEADQKALAKINVQATVVPNCIDVLRYQQPVFELKPHFNLMFTGKMDYRPNIDAVLWFAKEIWPLVQKKIPDISWGIVGQKPTELVMQLNQMEGITVMGWVPSIRPYLAGADLYIIPLRMGSGTRLKLIEAMAMGKGIVSTSIGAEGFPIADGEQLLLADEPRQFAAQIIRLLEDTKLKREMGDKAALFAQQYDWRVLIPLFDQIYEK